jgi:hypothetical protein
MDQHVEPFKVILKENQLKFKKMDKKTLFFDSAITKLLAKKLSK